MELLIALSITAVVCGILAVLINATATGTNAQNDGRRSLVRLQAIKACLNDEFVNARAVLETGSNYVVYWIGDQAGAVVPANNAVNLSELRLLEVDAAGNLNLYSVQWPAGTNSAVIAVTDATCAASTSWYATCTTLKATGYFPASTIATGVTGMAVSLDAASATAARLAHFRIDCSDGAVSRQVVLAVGLVSPLAPY
jgi:hypothetical protein